VKKILKKILPNKIKHWLFNINNLYITKYRDYYWSQEGEDIILRRIFENKKSGFYVDIGAHHPYRFSSTYYFYRKGWRGINIDANPKSIELFEKFRKRDINLNLAIGLNKRIMKYYMFNEPALNTFDEFLAKQRSNIDVYKIIAMKEVEVYQLKDVLGQFLPKGQEIDFMNIDVEGLDFEVIKSNDWNKYRPRVLLVEILPAHKVEELRENEIYKYLKDIGYNLLAKCFNTCIFTIEDNVK